MSAKTLRRAGMALIVFGILGGTAMVGPSAEARVSLEVVVPLRPPAARVEDVPPPPRHDRVAWQPGYWQWDGHAYAWIPGHYVEVPRHRRHWQAGRWEERRGGWVFVEGRWR